MTNDDLYNRGMIVRRAVLGDEYVDAALANATEFSTEMQDLVTQYCWGEIWTRPGLERSQRSLINLAMITVLNRPHELAAHVRGALNNGLTRDQIKEVFLQTAIYCGVPAAIDSFRTANEVFSKIDSGAEDA